ncbi:MAG: hypothetical protein ACD_5C00031G0006 [uncultured bacterium]|nr:MAG: hypothetical protein ACD_5C00031G0006 [uncultured bacterium]
MNITKEKIIIFSILLFSVISFFAFGFFHLAQFETTDEHLWKYGRIQQYWQAIGNQEWEDTYINDKPGVTVALVSGFGLLKYPDPEKDQMVAVTDPGMSGVFEKYNAPQSEKINFAFRFPVLVFSTLSLLLFFYLSSKAFNSNWKALAATLFIAFNPILVGISQIINPDSFFWIFGGLSMFSYLAYLNNAKQKKFLILCGILTGFALLSKYTAFMLFLFYGLAEISKIIFQSPSEAEKTDWKKLRSMVLDITKVFIMSITVFSLLLPAVFVHPEYLFKGISQFLNIKSIILLFIAFLGIFLLANYKKNLIGKISKILASKRHVLASIACALFLILISTSLLNVWTDQKLARVDALRDAAYANEPKEFNFKPLIDKRTNPILKNAELFVMEAYPFIFSLKPFFFVFILILTVRSLKRKIMDENAAIAFTTITFSIAYFASTIFAGIITNVRYTILLYPMFAILGVAAVSEIGQKFRLKDAKIFLIASILLSLLGLSTLWSLRPFYFSYANILLPEKFSIHDSWGHGSYEAAQHLNSLSNAKDLIIWSNSDTVCRFFEGKCLRSRKIDLSKVTPDYFVISKRGELKLNNRFVFTNNTSQKDSDYYFDKLNKDFVWQLLIDNRPDNYIKIIKFEK